LGSERDSSEPVGLIGMNDHRRKPMTKGTGRYLVASSLVLALFVAPLAIARTGDPLHGGKRNPSHGDFTRETQVIAENGTYGTRQSNTTVGDGGGAIYGCRSALGKEPCVRANNLKAGRAFEFASRSGTEGGEIRVGSGNPNAKAVPFRTNAAGKVANLNADKVDDLSSEQIVAAAKALWAVVADGGSVTRNNGVTGSAHLGPGDFEIAFNRDVTACVYSATLGSTDTTDPPAGEVGVAQRAGKTNAVRVVTRDSNGTAADHPFHLAVTC
jgi:hypothetical protein